MEWDTGIQNSCDELLKIVFPPVLNYDFHDFILDDGYGRFQILFMRAMTLRRSIDSFSCLLSFILMLKSWEWCWVLVHLDYSISSGHFLTMNFEFDQDHGPRAGLKLDSGIYS